MRGNSRPSVLALTLLFGLALFGSGCPTPAPGEDAAIDAPASGSDAPMSDVPSADYVPAGFTLTPELSPGGSHSFARAEMVLAPGTDYAMVIETSVGRIVIDLLEVEAPISVNSYVFLTRHHFFDGILFHRVINGFMAQTGDPNTLMSSRSTWGTGGCGYQFNNEIAPGLSFDGAGVVGMANAGPNTNGSQFFITFAAATHLDGDYNIFGRVTEGLDVLPMVVRGEPPATPTAMVRAYIVERPR